jgi:hypothetical protein
VPESLSLEEQALLKSPDSEGLGSGTVMLLLYGCGLRTQELSLCGCRISTPSVRS